MKQFAAIAQGGEIGQGAARDLGLALTEAFSPQAIGLAVFNKVFSESMDVLDAFDKGLASLSGKTGTVGKFNDNLYDARRSKCNRRFERRDISIRQAIKENSNRFGNLHFTNGGTRG